MKAERFFTFAAPVCNYQTQGEELKGVIPASVHVQCSKKVHTLKSYNLKLFLKGLQIRIPA